MSARKRAERKIYYTASRGDAQSLLHGKKAEDRRDGWGFTTLECERGILSALPAAEATVANSRQSSAQKMSSFPRFKIFIINYSPFHSSTNTTERTSCSVTGCETADTTAS